MHVIVRGREWLISLARLATVAVSAPVALILLMLLVGGLVLIPVFGIGIPVVAGAIGAARGFTELLMRVLGIDAARTYTAEPGWSWREIVACIRDPQTSRDVMWLAAHSSLGILVLVLSWGISLAIDGLFDKSQPIGILTIPVLAIFAIIYFVVPWVLHGFVLLGRSLLGPGGVTLQRRVEQLTESRAATVDAQAAELRRIERDLHDGAQARLAAVRMTLGLASQLLRTDPDRTAELLVEAREDAGKALAELRDLVRGIHPPVLADRGLAGGLEAAALLCPVPVDATVTLDGRPQAPVESALYFAGAEALANIGRHSDATRAWLRVSHDGAVLRVVVGDDGNGGADPRGGTGLRGIERRLAAFDGTLTVASPPGGPTELTMEVPCTLARSSQPSVAVGGPA